MKRLLVMLLLVLGCSTIASAMDSAQGWCEEGNRPVVTSGLTSTTRVQVSHPQCTVTIFVHGGGLATIYSDNNLTALANPFTARTDGQWQFYAENGRYDVTMASAGFSQTITYSDIILCDPFETNSTCNSGGGGGGSTPHNLLSTTHLDTIPASPPGRGSLVTAQNQTSPTGVNPAWAELLIGDVLKVLKSDGSDAGWDYSLTGELSGSAVATRSQLNVIPGTNTSITFVDNPGSNRLDLTIGATSVSTTVNGSTCTLGSTCNSGHHGLEFTIYNGGVVLTSGTTVSSYALMAAVPFACTIDGWSLAADQGTATIKWWKVATGTAIPTSGNSINTSGVQLSTGTKVDSTTLSDFTTTAIAKNDSLIMDISAVAGGMTYIDGVLSCHE